MVLPLACTIMLLLLYTILLVYILSFDFSACHVFKLKVYAQIFELQRNADSKTSYYHLFQTVQLHAKCYYSIRNYS